MTLKTFLRSSLFLRIVLLIWLISSGLVMFSQQTVDSIVNVTLYHYGLQPSPDWLQPYWFYARMLYASQFVSIALTAVALASGLRRKKPDQNGDRSAPQREETTARGIVISCPTCKKVITKPLVMLDFTGGKARLVNGCPYCNTVLGTADKRNYHRMIVGEPDKAVQEQ
jgi:uncharacterized Zn-finger protein